MWNMFNVNNKNDRTMSNFEQENVGWVIQYFQIII